MLDRFKKYTLVSLGCAVSLAVVEAKPTQAFTLTPGNILISTEEVLYEYTSEGSFIQSVSIPAPTDSPFRESARDIVVDHQGNIQVYNGTFDPFLSTFDVDSETWASKTYPGWSTANNVSYGGIAAFKNKVFVTDMRTFGDNGADQAQGIVVFDQDNGTSSRFAENIEPIDLNLGLDQLLYALSPGGSPGGRSVSVYNPTTLEKIRDIDLVASLGFSVDRRSIAVNSLGELFVATWDGDIFHINAQGELLNSLKPECTGLSFSSRCYFNDIDIAEDGTIILGSRFGDIVVTDESFSDFQSFQVGRRNAFVSFVPSQKPSSSVPEPSAVLGLIALTLGAFMKKKSL